MKLFGEKIKIAKSEEDYGQIQQERAATYFIYKIGFVIAAIK